MTSTTESEDKLSAQIVADLKFHNYKADKFLGAGTFGRVFRITESLTNGTTTTKAVKIMAIKANNIQYLAQELAALITVHHNNIVGIHRVYKAHQTVFVIMDFCAGGDLWDYIEANGAQPVTTARKWFLQLISAVKCLHLDHRVAHRDLKPNNVLLNEDKSQVLLTDFTFAKYSINEATNEVNLTKTMVNTEAFRSPQVTMSYLYNPYSADIWSLGVLLYYIVKNDYAFGCEVGRPQRIYERMNSDKHLKKVLQGLDSNLKDLLRKMWLSSESDRIKVDLIEHHPWCNAQQ